MSAPKGNKNAKGNKGGGRLKNSDLSKLQALWDGEITFSHLGFAHDLTRNRLEFNSGLDAFCYKVLTGDTSMIRVLIDKLFADQKYAEPDVQYTSVTREHLKTMSKEELERYREHLTDQLGK